MVKSLTQQEYSASADTLAEGLGQKKAALPTYTLWERFKNFFASSDGKGLSTSKIAFAAGAGLLGALASSELGFLAIGIGLAAAAGGALLAEPAMGWLKNTYGGGEQKREAGTFGFIRPEAPAPSAEVVSQRQVKLPVLKEGMKEQVLSFPTYDQAANAGHATKSMVEFREAVEELYQGVKQASPQENGELRMKVHAFELLQIGREQNLRALVEQLAALHKNEKTLVEYLTSIGMSEEDAKAQRLLPGVDFSKLPGLQSGLLVLSDKANKSEEALMDYGLALKLDELRKSNSKAKEGDALAAWEALGAVGRRQYLQKAIDHYQSEEYTIGEQHISAFFPEDYTLFGSHSLKGLRRAGGDLLGGNSLVKKIQAATAEKNYAELASLWDERKGQLEKELATKTDEKEKATLQELVKKLDTDVKALTAFSHIADMNNYMRDTVVPQLNALDALDKNHMAAYGKRLEHVSANMQWLQQQQLYVLGERKPEKGQSEFRVFDAKHKKTLEITQLGERDAKGEVLYKVKSDKGEAKVSVAAEAEGKVLQGDVLMRAAIDKAFSVNKSLAFSKLEGIQQGVKLNLDASPQASSLEIALSAPPLRTPAEEPKPGLSSSMI